MFTTLYFLDLRFTKIITTKLGPKLGTHWDLNCQHPIPESNVLTQWTILPMEPLFPLIHIPTLFLSYLSTTYKYLFSTVVNLLHHDLILRVKNIHLNDSAETWNWKIFYTLLD